MRRRIATNISRRDSMEDAVLSVQRIAGADGSEHVHVNVHCPTCDRTLHAELGGNDESLPGLRMSHERRPVGPLVARGDALVATNVPLSSVMTRDVVCVTEDTSIEDVRALFLLHHISGTPVVDESGKAVGMVTKTDLVRLEAEQIESQFATKGDDDGNRLIVMTDEGYRYELGHGFHVERLTRATVREVMMHVVFALPMHAPLSRAAALMAFEGIHRVVVLGSDGAVAGIVSTMDLARWLADQPGRGLPLESPKQSDRETLPPSQTFPASERRHPCSVSAT